MKTVSGMKKRICALLGGVMLTVSALAAAPEAYSVSAAKVNVDGWNWKLPVITTYDANGGGTSYVKLRDVAYILQGTGGAFSVEFDGSTVLTTGGSYTPLGTELQGAAGTELKAARSVVVLDGESRTLDAVWAKANETDYFIYYKLRDLGDALGLSIGWDAELGVTIQTPAKPETSQEAAETKYDGMSEYDREIWKVIEQDKLGES